MHVVAAAASETGIRERNEDAYGIFPQDGVFCIADGMGGLSEGNVASRAAVSVVADATTQLGTLSMQVKEPTDLAVVVDSVEALYRQATRHLWTLSHDNGATMGTTLTTVVLAGDRLVLGHLGDTRAVLIRDRKARVLTQDHTVAAAHLRMGLLTLDQYRTSPSRNILYQCLGPHAQTEPEFREITLHHGDVVLLMSDGVWSFLDDDALVSIAATQDPRAAARHLVDQALALGSDDNCTAVVLHAGAEKPAPTVTGNLTISEIFSACTEADLMLLSPYVAERDLAEGETVLREGQNGEELFIVAKGAVEVTRKGQPLAQLGPGKHFGEIPVPRDGPRTTSVQAMVPTRLLVLDSTYMDALQSARPQFAQALLRRFQLQINGSRIQP